MSIKLQSLLKRIGKLHPRYIDLSLNRITYLLEKLDNPHLKLPPTIHIAGTNGKGSTLSYIYNILKKNSYISHCYTSPHLINFEERFIISNKQINEKKLINTLKYVLKINNNNKITFFELTTAAAFFIFSKKKSDFLILETGLGGRLDATNVIHKSLINIFVPISLDHQEFLGNNVYKITKEKLGIIKKKSIIIVGKQKPNVKKFIENKIKRLENKKIFYGKNYYVKDKKDSYFCLNYKNKIINLKNPSLSGDHQIENAATAISAIMELKNLGYKIKKNLINKGLSQTFWPGRLEKRYLKNIPVYLDGAHNKAGANQIKIFFENKKLNRWLILGMLNNKDLKGYLLKVKNIFTGVIAVKIPGEKNSFSSQDINKICKKINLRCICKKNIKDANLYLLNKIVPDEIVISGSLYLIGKVRKLYS